MKTAIIDLDSVCYSIGHGVKLLDENGQPRRENNKFVYRDKTEEELRQAADSWMNQILTLSKATHYIAYIKGIATTDFRVAANPDYKAKRNKQEPSWWRFVQDYLIVEWQAYDVNLIEVDDAVNITRLKLKDSFIVALDGDLLGLTGLHYNWRDDKWVTVTPDEAEYKFWSDMICGQTVDGIKGIPGKGEAFVKRKFNAYFESLISFHEGVLSDYIEHFGEYEGIKQFYSNYIALKTLETHPTFTIPEPIEFKKKQEEINLFN